MDNLNALKPIAVICLALLCLGLFFGCTSNKDTNTGTTVLGDSNKTVIAPSVIPAPVVTPPVVQPPKVSWISDQNMYYTIGPKITDSYTTCVGKEGYLFQVTEIEFDFKNQGSTRIPVSFKVIYDNGAKSTETTFSYYDAGSKRIASAQLDDCWNKVTVEALNYDTKAVLDSIDIVVNK